MSIRHTTDLPSLPASSSTDEIVSELNRAGGVILRNFLTAEQVDNFNKDIDDELERLAPGSKYDDEFIAAFHGNNTKRLTGLPMLSATFRNDILDHDVIHNVSEAIYREDAGDYWLTTGQVIDIGPGNPAQLLHRDLENGPIWVKLGPAGPMVMINFIIALCDFTEEIGATRVIPGSQDWPDYEDRGSDDMTIPVIMNAGDCFLFSCKVVHGGGANTTTDKRRRALTVPVQPAYLLVEEPYHLTVDLDVVKTMAPRAQKMLGFMSLFPKGSPGLMQVNYEELGDYLRLDA